MARHHTWFPPTTSFSRKTSFSGLFSSMVGKSLLFPRTFFDVISTVEKFTFFQRTFFDVFRWSKNPRCFHVLFWFNFNGWKIHVVFTYFFQCSFSSRNIHGVSTYFFRRNLGCRKSHFVFARTLFDKILMDKKSTSFLVSCKLMKTFEGVFLC